MEQAVEQERLRLCQVASEWTKEQTIHTAKSCRLALDGSIEELKDRIIRYDLRRLFGAEATWKYPLKAEDLTRGNLSESLSGIFDESISADGRLSIGTEPLPPTDIAPTSMAVTSTTSTSTTSVAAGSTGSATVQSSLPGAQPQVTPSWYPTSLPTIPSTPYPFHSTVWATQTPFAPPRTRRAMNPDSPPFGLPSRDTAAPVPTPFSQPHINPLPPHWAQANVPPTPSVAFEQAPYPPRNRDLTREPLYEETARPSFYNGASGGYSLDTSFQRETSTCNLLRRYEVSFSGQPKEDVEEFLDKLQDFQDSLRVEDVEIIRLVPVILTGAARYWARPLFRSWSTVQELAEALRLQYGIPDFQNRLREEIHARTQGPDEPISSYLSAMRQLLDKCSPKLTLRAQLDKIYRNLYPDFADAISRDQFDSFAKLQSLCREEEVKRERRRAYRPPPPSDRALFPELAYKPVRKLRTAAIEASRPAANFPSTLQPEEEPLAAVQQSVRENRSNSQPRAIETSSVPNSAPVRQPGNSQTPRARNVAPPRGANTRCEPPPKRSIAIQTKATDVTPRPISPERNRAPPPDNSPCWVCKQGGHWARQCPLKNGIVCFRCNYPGVTTPQCPHCNPRQRAGNARRGN